MSKGWHSLLHRNAGDGSLRRMLKLLYALLMLAAAPAFAADEVTLLNASYDPTRELYAEYNRTFAERWNATTGQKLRVRMSHGGSGKQARAVTDGLQADVVTLALGADLDAIAARGLMRTDWENALPERSAPYRSTIVLLVRKGNPHAIHDWDDLAKPGVNVLTPNPKTSGGARWNYLAALAYAKKNYNAKGIDQFMKAWLRNVSIFDTGARGATTNFVRRKQGDVLVTWENEAYIAKKYFGDDAFEIIYPSVSILCEPPVAVVDSVVDARGTRDVAVAYLKGLYEPEAQKLIAENFFRPLDAKDSTLPSITNLLITVEQMGGWPKLQKDHFAEGGSFDRYTAR